MQLLSHEPQRVLITGGASGIGAAVVERCLADGYDPIILDRVGKTAFHCDLADPISTRKALDRALSRGPITRLVNNVGGLFENSVSDQTLDEFNNAIALNLRSALLCTQAVLPGMREAGFGRIVSMSSRAALGKELRTAYSATKAGLQGMTRTWALEEGNRGVTANSVAPGPIATNQLYQTFPPGALAEEALVGSIPVGRLGSADDVAHSVSFLLDERSGFVTGQNLYVCGGLTVGSTYI